MSKPFFNPSECNKLHLPSHLSVRSVLLHFVQRSPPETRTLCKGGKKVNLFYSARFSHFIDSLKLFFPFHNGFAKRFLCVFFKSVFYIGCSTNCVNRADKITEIINYFRVLFVHFDCFCKVFNTAS